MKIITIIIMIIIQHRHILIVCALGQESQVVRSVLKGHVFQGIKFHYHTCGLGLEKSMMNLTQFLSKSDIVFDLVINIGIAGYVTSILSDISFQGTLVQSLRIIQGDVKKELCVPPQYLIDEILIVPLTSRYRVVRDKSQLDFFLQYDDIISVDMEGYSIESVCNYFGYSRMFLKVLYDQIGQDNIKDYDEMLNIMKQTLFNLPSLLKNVL